MKNDFDIEHDTLIDPDNLDVALVELPNLIFKYSELSAEAENDQREAEENLKVVRSRLILYANENPEEIEGGKATGQTVEAYYRTQEDYIVAKKQLHKAEYEASMIKNAIFAIYAKRQALEQLIKLLSMEYFTGPEIAGNLSEKISIVKQRAKSRIASSLNDDEKPSSRKKTSSKKRSKTSSRKR